MVQLHVKRGDESQFLFSTTVDISLETLIEEVTAIHNGRLKVDRICSGHTLSPTYSTTKTFLIVEVVLYCVFAVCLCVFFFYRSTRACRTWHNTTPKYARPH